MLSRSGIAAVLAALAAAGIVAPEDATSTASRQAAEDCRVTRANGPDGVHGRGSISVSLGSKATWVASDDPQTRPEGTMVAQRRPDGSIYAKILWYRSKRAYGRFRITGRERTTQARARLNGVDESHTSPIVPSSLIFSEPGCWRITARAGKGRLRFTIRVVDATSQSREAAPG